MSLIRIVTIVVSTVLVIAVLALTLGPGILEKNMNTVVPHSPYAISDEAND